MSTKVPVPKVFHICKCGHKKSTHERAFDELDLSVHHGACLGYVDSPAVMPRCQCARYEFAREVAVAHEAVSCL